MLRILRRFRDKRSGATAIEYGLIAALVAIGAIFGLREYGVSLELVYRAIDGEVEAATASSAASGSS